MRMQSGFTLVEMVMTVSIILVLSTLAAPNFITWINGYHLRAATSRLMMTLQQARLYAVKTNAKIVITFDPEDNGETNGNYEIFVDNGLGSGTLWTREPDEKLVKRDCISEGIQLHDVAFAGGKPRMRFSHLGLPNGFGGHIYLTNSKNQYLGIHVNITGNPRIVKSRDGTKGSWD